MRSRFAALFLLFLAAVGSRTYGQDYVYDAGSPSYGVNIPVENGFINVSNGNLHMEFPLATHTQRGNLSLNERLVYDSRFWKIGKYSQYHWWPDNLPRDSHLAMGWRFVTGAEIGTLQDANISNTIQCAYDTYSGYDGTYGYTYQVIYIYKWQDAQGTLHSFNVDFPTQTSDCSSNPPNPQTYSGTASDSSGYRMTMSGDDQSAPNVTIVDVSGTQVYPRMVDRYGNNWSLDGNGNLIDDRGQMPVITSYSGNQIFYDVLTANGNRARYTVTTNQFNLNTHFQQSGVDEQSITLPGITRIQLPDGSAYNFTYDSSFGELQSMQLPAGGTVSYDWTTYFDSYNNANRWVSSYTVGYDPPTTFTPAVMTQCSSAGTGCQEKVTVHEPMGDETVYTLLLNNGAWNTTAQRYAGAVANNNLLLTSTTDYDFSNACGAACNGSQYITAQRKTTTLNDTGLKLTTAYTYNDPTLGLVSSVRNYDYYTGALPSNPLTETDYTYDAANDITRIQTIDGAGNYLSAQTRTYNGSPTFVTSGLPGHGQASGPYLASSSDGVNTTTYEMDDAGVIVTATSPDGKTTYTHDPTDTFVTGVMLPTPSSGVTLSSSTEVDAGTGLPASVTDENGQTTTYTGYDEFGRVGEVDLPNGGKINYYYNPTQLGTAMTNGPGSNSTDREEQMDVFGRTSRTAVNNGQGSWYQQDTCYNANGRVSTTSVPYTGQGWGTAKQCSGTSYTYDSMGRPFAVSNADGTVQYGYRGRATSVRDVNGVTKISQVDGLGRITAVCEISTQSPVPAGVVNCGLDIAGNGFLTTYQYDLFTHTTYVRQGSQTRLFQTDTIGRTIHVGEPESGDTHYIYDRNQTGQLVTKTSPRANQQNISVTTKTTTQYDLLGRVVSVSYDDGFTPGKNYYYDTAPPGQGWSTAPSNAKARLTGTSTTTNTRAQFSYDVMGNVVAMWQCTPAICGTGSQESRPTLQFDYDQTGHVIRSFDGATGSIKYTRTQAGQITSVTNQSYTDPANTPNLATNVVNGPFGNVSMNLGNGLNTYTAYDNVGRPEGHWLCNGGSPTGKSCPGGQQYWGHEITVRHGDQLVQDVDTVENHFTNYGYDEFGRMTAANQANGSHQYIQSYNWSYDQYGNRQYQANNGSSGPPTRGISVDLSTNRITLPGYSYDAAGNMTADGAHTYTYDAEGNLVGMDGGTAQYVYDAMNRRVSTVFNGSQRDYIFDPFGQQVSQWLMPQNFGMEGRIYMDGQMLAYRAFNGTTYFTDQNLLGTSRVRTDHNGGFMDAFQSLYYGDDFRPYNGTDPNGADQDTRGFAGMEHDGESGTEHASYRQYSPVNGRWMSPDPYAGSYDFTSPQSFNRYTYANNNPGVFADPLGLQAGCGIDCSGSGGSGSADNIAAFIVQALVGGIESLFGLGQSSFHGSLSTRPSTMSHLPDGSYVLYTGVSEYTYFLPNPNLSFISTAFLFGGGQSGPSNIQTCPQTLAFARNLDYTTPMYKGGVTVQQHIESRHMSGVGAQGVSQYYANDFARVRRLNMFTFLLAVPRPDGNSLIYDFTFPNVAGLIDMQNYVGTGSNGRPTLTNHLVVRPTDCKPVTSYPIH